MKPAALGGRRKASPTTRGNASEKRRSRRAHASPAVRPSGPVCRPAAPAWGGGASSAVCRMTLDMQLCSSCRKWRADCRYGEHPGPADHRRVSASRRTFCSCCKSCMSSVMAAYRAWRRRRPRWSGWSANWAAGPYWQGWHGARRDRLFRTHCHGRRRGLPPAASAGGFHRSPGMSMKPASPPSPSYR